MNLQKISLSFFFLIFFTFSLLSFSEENKEGHCSHIVSSNPNCACNALVSAFNLLGIDVTEEEITRLTPIDRDGLTSMYDLLKASQQKGLNPKALRLTYEELTKTSMPVIVHLTTNHFITLKEAKNNGIISIDKGRETVISKEGFLKSYSGYCITLNPKTKGLALSNNKLRQIKGAHCTCGGCSASNCNTGLCGGALSCSSSNCEGTCPGGGDCYFCPIRISQWCGGFGSQDPCGCNGSSCPRSGTCASKNRCDNLQDPYVPCGGTSSCNYRCGANFGCSGNGCDMICNSAVGTPCGTPSSCMCEVTKACSPCSSDKICNSYGPKVGSCGGVTVQNCACKLFNGFSCNCSVRYICPKTDESPTYACPGWVFPPLCDAYK